MIELCKWGDIDVFISDSLMAEDIRVNFMGLGIQTLFAQVT